MEANTYDFDATLQAAMEFVQYAHKKDSDFQGTVCFNVADQTSGAILQKYVKVSPTVEISDNLATPASCTVNVSKEILLAILGGTLDPMIAFMCGQILIDNPIVLAQFAQAFDLGPAKLEEFKKKLQGEVNEVQNSTTVVADATNSQGPINGELPITAKAAKKTLELLTSLSKISKEINVAMGQLKDNSQYQSLVSKAEEIKKSIKTSETYQKIQSHPAVQQLVETIITQYKANKVDESISTYLAKSSEFKSMIINYLVSQSNSPPVTPDQRAEKKMKLEQQLQELMEKNKKSDDEVRAKFSSAFY